MFCEKEVKSNRVNGPIGRPLGCKDSMERAKDGYFKRWLNYRLKKKKFEVVGKLGMSMSYSALEHANILNKKRS